MAFGKSYKDTFKRRIEKGQLKRLHSEFRKKASEINQAYLNDPATRATEIKRLRQEMNDQVCNSRDMGQVVLSRTLEREKYFSNAIGRVRHRIL
jgi:hypothetical protein